MKQEAFDALVARLEKSAKRNPGLYKLRVVGLALFGYGYLVGILLLLIALLIGALASLAVLKGLAIKLIIPIAGFVWLVLKAMWVRIAAPEGYALKRKEAPALFARVDSIRRQLKAPQFHRILITDDFNAAVVQVPRLGLLGWHRNYLLLGLPLMKTLTTEQLAAVLAHEFGHLAGGHGRFGNWIYRLRMSWARLQHALEQSQHWGSFVFRPFIQRFVPYFNAYSFPLARANEFEADAASARLTSPMAAAEALTSVNVMGAWIGERYWPRVHALADQQPAPSFAPYASLGQGYAGELGEEDTQRWLEQALARKTSGADTHPSLSDRLAAIGQAPRIAPPAAGQAADSLLGDALAGITAAMDRQWQQAVEPGWARRHAYVTKSRERMAELDSKLAQGAELSVDEACEHARLTEEFGAGADAALAELRVLQARAPQSAVVCYALGQRLLARDDEQGAALVQEAMRLDEEAVLPGCELLRDYYWRTGAEAQAQEWHARLLERSQFEQKLRAERDVVQLKDKFEKHGLTAEQLAQFQRELCAIQGLRKAYFVRKIVKHQPEKPCYVLGFCATPWWSWHRKQRVAEIQQRILDTVVFPGETMVVNVEGDNYRFYRKLRWRRGSRVV